MHGRGKTGSPVNARTSPDGEKETAYTQPPAGLPNSQQTVSNGSFSPQNVGAGLDDTIIGSDMRKRHRLPIHVLDVRGENPGLHVRTASDQQHIVRVPINGKDGGPDGFLEEFRDPPVALLVEGVDRDGSDNSRSTLTRSRKDVGHT